MATKPCLQMDMGHSFFWSSAYLEDRKWTCGHGGEGSEEKRKEKRRE